MVTVSSSCKHFNEEYGEDEEDEEDEEEEAIRCCWSKARTPEQLVEIPTPFFVKYSVRDLVSSVTPRTSEVR